MNEWLEELRQLLGERLRCDEPMSAHTTYGIGGPAEGLARLESVEELTRVMAVCGKWGVRVTVLGKGSNVLVSDAGVRGLVVNLGGELAQVRLETGRERVWAGGGAAMDSLARETLKAGLAGLEWAAGLPGTVGGAVAGNAGAWGGSVKDRLLSVEVCERNGEIRSVEAAELGLVYRGSRLGGSGRVVTGARFGLEKGNREELEAKAREYGRRRRDTQPGGRSAGSVFRNPEGGSAGKMLEEALCKGLKKGGAVVSGKHANFIVNEGGATAGDVMWLMEEMERRVKEKFGVELEREVIMVGEW